MDEQKTPVTVCHVAGREFLIYREYDEQMQTHYLTYPDFFEAPVYAGDGRPFARSDYEDCAFYKAKAPDTPLGECGDCLFFHREETPADVIGICMCDARRNENEEEN